MDKLQMCHIKDEYVNYLRSFDNKVPFNKGETRPYVGVVIKCKGYDYFAPLSSPKTKHLTMREQLDLYKIDNGKLGVINLNNMIPVTKDNVLVFNINEKPDDYKNLLNKQIKYINNDKEKLLKKANKLRDFYEKNYVPSVSQRCCNFILLEDKAKEYLTKEIAKQAEQEAAATKYSSIKDTIVDIYIKEMPAIKYISEEIATLINKVNSSSEKTLTISEIKEHYNKIGTKLEKVIDKNTLKEFTNLSRIVDEFKRCKLELKKDQSEEITVKIKTKSFENELK